MGQLLRKIRGALGVAVTWGTVWAIVFYLLGLVIGLLSPASIDPGETQTLITAIGAWYGFFSGTMFSLLLATVERNKSIRDLSLWRVALWGAIATSVWPLLTPVSDGMAVMFAPVGAGLAAGLVALARRGKPRAAELAVGGPSETV